MGRKERREGGGMEGGREGGMGGREEREEFHYPFGKEIKSTEHEMYII